jgi:hypothetical protein
MGSYVPFPVSTALSLSARVLLLRVNARTAEASSAVALLGLHLLVDKPERVDVSRDVTETALGLKIAETSKNLEKTHIVRRILMRRSQLQPVMKAEVTQSVNRPQ